MRSSEAPGGQRTASVGLMDVRFVSDDGGLPGSLRNLLPFARFRWYPISMAKALEVTYGLTTDDALLAYRHGRLDALAPANRWKPFLLDHAAGVHGAHPERFRRICLVCRAADSRSR